MQAIIQILIIVTVVFILSGCNTYRWWRDNYMGRAILEPNLLYQRIERDKYGNPILPKINLGLPLTGNEASQNE